MALDSTGTPKRANRKPPLLGRPRIFGPKEIGRAQIAATLPIYLSFGLKKQSLRQKSAGI
jgi:hypothetical protein